MKDSEFIIDLWFNEKMKESIMKKVDSLPIIARIIRDVRRKSRIRLSEILPRGTNEVRKVAENNFGVLQYYGIRLEKIQGGSILRKILFLRM